MKSSAPDKQAGFLTVEFDDADFSISNLEAHVLSADAQSFSVSPMAVVQN